MEIPASGGQCVFTKDSSLINWAANLALQEYVLNVGWDKGHIGGQYIVL